MFINSRRQPLKQILFRRSPFFLQFKEFELVWGATKRSIGEVLFFKINFIGVNFEAGNETREKIWSDFFAERNEEWSEKSGFCAYRCFLNSEKLR